ncbi:MAG TPA: hypothetical protein PLI09_28290 [Candidatus Hydrogenedentes bacterium]|nr:hypothetical protein [Candidatus Hydrogenedentota bacterium]
MSTIAVIFLGIVVGISFEQIFSVIIYSIIAGLCVMLLELLKGSQKANSIRHHLYRLAESEGLSPTNEDIELDLLNISIEQQFIYRFELLPFIAGSIVVTIYVLIPSLLAYGVKCLLG